MESNNNQQNLLPNWARPVVEFRNEIRSRLFAISRRISEFGLSYARAAQIIVQIRVHVTAGGVIQWNNNAPINFNDEFVVPQALEELVHDLAEYIAGFDAWPEEMEEEKEENAHEILQEYEEAVGQQHEFSEEVRQRATSLSSMLLNGGMLVEQIFAVIDTVRGFLTTPGHGLVWEDQGGVVLSPQVHIRINEFRNYTEGYDYPAGIVEDDKYDFIDTVIQGLLEELENETNSLSSASGIGNNNATSVASNNSRGMNVVGGGRRGRGFRTRGRRKTRRRARRTLRKKCRRGSRRFRKL